jgi:hypothetical protein
MASEPKSVTFDTTVAASGNNTGIVVPDEVIQQLAAGKRPSDFFISAAATTPGRCGRGSWKPSSPSSRSPLAGLPERSQVSYSRDESEKTLRRILIGDAHADDDGLGPPVRSGFPERGSSPPRGAARADPRTLRSDQRPPLAAQAGLGAGNWARPGRLYNPSGASRADSSWLHCRTSGKPQGTPPGGLPGRRATSASGFKHRRTIGVLGRGATAIHWPVGSCPRR